MFAYEAVKTTTEKMQGELDAAARGKDWELFQATHLGGRDWVLIWRFAEPEPPGVVAVPVAEAVAKIQRDAKQVAEFYGGQR